MLIKKFFVIEINNSSLRRDNLFIKDYFLSLLQEPSNVSRSMRHYRESLSSLQTLAPNFFNKPQTELHLNTVFQQLKTKLN